MDEREKSDNKTGIVLEGRSVLGLVFILTNEKIIFVALHITPNIDLKLYHNNKVIRKNISLVSITKLCYNRRYTRVYPRRSHST
jgi:hypothetical protein